MSHFEGFLLLLSYFTAIPVGEEIKYTDEKYKKGVHYFPFVGLFISLLVMCGMFLVGKFLYGLVGGAAVFLLYVLITGGIHIDGFADSVDGFFSGRSRDRVFEIMSDPHIGTFGVLGIVLLAAIYVGVFAETSFFQVLGVSLFAYVGRIAAYTYASAFDYAKPRGMGKIFVDSANPVIAALHIVFFVLFVFVLEACFGVGALRVFIAAAVAFAAAFVAAWSSCEKIGGLTGDSMGYIIEISQIFYLIAFIWGE